MNLNERREQMLIGNVFRSFALPADLEHIGEYPFDFGLILCRHPFEQGLNIA